MARYFKLNSFSLILLFILCLITACNNSGDEKKNDEKSPEDTSKKGTQVNQQATDIISGTLDTLWIESLKFTQLPVNKKLVFVFTFRQNDTLTLHGWTTKDSIFNSNPDIKLKKGRASTINYGNDMYFGNVILRRGAINSIKNLINTTNAQYVLFVPHIISGHHIGYKIFLGKEDPGMAEAVEVIPTGFEVNPSPPKNY